MQADDVRLPENVIKVHVADAVLLREGRVRPQVVGDHLHPPRRVGDAGEVRPDASGPDQAEGLTGEVHALQSDPREVAPVRSLKRRPEPPGEGQDEPERELRHRGLTIVRHVRDGDVPLPAGNGVDMVEPPRGHGGDHLEVRQPVEDLAGDAGHDEDPPDAVGIAGNRYVLDRERFGVQGEIVTARPGERPPDHVLFMLIEAEED